MFDHGLSSQQLEVICALSSGAAMTSAAQQAGVHRNTVNNWRRNSLPFQKALAGAQYDRALYFREKVEEHVDLALQAIHDILADPKTPASVRLKAALAIIHLAATPPPPKKQIELELERVVVDNSQPAPAEPSVAPEVHNPAQPVRRDIPKVGRNEACPCGSGIKYKRCCLNKPAAPPLRAAA